MAGAGSVDVLLEQARNNDKPMIRVAVKRPWGLCIHIQYAALAKTDAGKCLDFPNDLDAKLDWWMRRPA